MSSEPIPRRVQVTEAVVRRHQAGVWRYLRFLGCDPAAADDLTQETFVTALCRPPVDRGEAAFAGWLRTTALHLFRNLRRRPRVFVPLDADAIEAVWHECARDDAGAGYLRALRHCLTHLSPDQRRAIDIRYRDRGDRGDVATALGLRAEGAKTLLRRARRQLRACIEGTLQRSEEDRR